MVERKLLRLKNWDYSKEGIYFVTICCYNKQKFFGSIYNGQLTLSEIGEISSQYWFEIPQHFSHVKLDEFVVMPNHIHGLLILDYSLVGPRHGVALHSAIENKVGSCHGMTLQSQFSRPIKNSVSVIINQYKSTVKRWCNKNGYKNFQWQSRYYDQILRNEISIDNIREYMTFHLDAVGVISIQKTGVTGCELRMVLRTDLNNEATSSGFLS